MTRSALWIPALGLVLGSPLLAQDVSGRAPYRPGMVVTRSLSLRPGTYAAPAGDSAAIVVRGEGITLDLTGVVLIGTPDRRRPDRTPLRDPHPG